MGDPLSSSYQQWLIQQQLGGLNNGIGTTFAQIHSNSNTSSYAGLAAGTLYGYAGYPTGFGSVHTVKRTGIKVGEIIGWRMWGVKGKYLQSYSAGRTYAPNEIMEGKPTDHNSEGIWAFKEKSRAIHKMLGDGINAYGSILMWGDIIEHEDGYRSQYAKIRSIDDVHGYSGNKNILLYNLKRNYGFDCLKPHVSLIDKIQNMFEQ